MNRRFVFNATDPYFLQCVNYDPVANAIYGLGFNEGNLSLISFSSQNSSMIVIGKTKSGFCLTIQPIYPIGQKHKVLPVQLIGGVVFCTRI